MKKHALETLVAYFRTQNGLPSDVADAVDEMKAELAKNAEKAAANRELYDATHDIFVDALTDTPQTIAEIWKRIKEDVPEKMTKSKIQYAVREYWAGDVVKVEGAVNMYRKRV